MSKLILIFALIGFCLTDDDTCYTTFKTNMNSKCQKINSNCQYFISTKKCTAPKADCSGGTSSTCSSIILTDHNIKKCKWDGNSCTPTDKLCEDYDSTWGDTCGDLKPETGKGDQCRLSYSKKCTPHFNSCGSITKQDQCNNNILIDKTKKCVWKNNACTEETRSCDDSYHLLQSSDCTNLKALDTNKKCFYLNKACSEYYESCEDYKGSNKTICENLTPINSAKNGYDTSKNCTFDASATNKCQTKDIMCLDYILKGEEDNQTCYLLTASDSNKHCIYDFEKGQCREEYKSCQVYNDLTGVQKKKEICEAITLIGDDQNKKCVFKDNACQEEPKKCSDYKLYEPVKYCTEISKALEDKDHKACKFNGTACIEDYITCGSYIDGNDKKTCESIFLDKGQCILKQDTNCELKPLACSDYKTQLDCMSILELPDNPRKKCFFYGNQCIEMYKDCDSYNGYYKQECETIVPLDGTNCVFQSPKCVATPKTCSEGLIKEECNFITLRQSGLSNPKKMICDYDSSSGKCFENYKYCSDYTGTDADVCSKIKPYNSAGTDRIEGYKCVYDENVGCERKLLGCSEAKTSTNCEIISDLLKTATNSKKYCAFFNGTCTEQYFECSKYDTNVQKEVCQAIIPDDYETMHCVYKDESGKITCEAVANDCESFDVDKYKYECISLGPFCSYSDGVCSTVAKACSEIAFPLGWTGDKEKTCSGIKVENENKLCSLSSDKTKCEEVDKPSEKEETPASSNSGTTSQNNQNSESQEDSSDSSNLLQLKGIKLILTLLYLLI